MLLTEYNEELDRKELFELGREEGLAEGRMEGLTEGRMEGLTEGRIEGLTEGVLKSKREDILEILYSLGDVPEELRQLIANQSDSAVLKSWLLSAITASSVSEFSQSMNRK